MTTAAVATADEDDDDDDDDDDGEEEDGEDDDSVVAAAVADDDDPPPLSLPWRSLAGGQRQAPPQGLPALLPEDYLEARTAAMQQGIPSGMAPPTQWFGLKNLLQAPGSKVGSSIALHRVSRRPPTSSSLCPAADDTFASCLLTTPILSFAPLLPPSRCCVLLQDDESLYTELLQRLDHSRFDQLQSCNSKAAETWTMESWMLSSLDLASGAARKAKVGGCTEQDRTIRLQGRAGGSSPSALSRGCVCF